MGSTFEFPLEFFDLVFIGEEFILPLDLHIALCLVHIQND